MSSSFEKSVKGATKIKVSSFCCLHGIVPVARESQLGANMLI